VPPYSLAVAGAEAALELPLPRWVLPSEDLRVEISQERLTISLDGAPGGPIERTFWRPRSVGVGAEADSSGVVLPAESGWSVADEAAPPSGGGGSGGGARPGKTLLVTLALRQEGEEEARAAGSRAGAGHPSTAPRGPGALAGAGRHGWELFEEDEDAFGLREVLQVWAGRG
jgi:hypothetical protein